MGKSKELELKERMNLWKGVAIAFIIMFMVVWMLGSVCENKSKKLKQELQTCQDQMPVWMLEIECSYPNEDIYVYGQYNFTNHTEYLEVKEEVDRLDICKVIE